MMGGMDSEEIKAKLRKATRMDGRLQVALLSLVYNDLYMDMGHGKGEAAYAEAQQAVIRIRDHAADPNAVARRLIHDYALSVR
jgi:hypothetical protein